jgi:bifunctional non-homologous end joining protein LigD
MARSTDLTTYNAKRDFTKTREPKGEPAATTGNIFMVQKHDATRLHFDLRLELDGVLKSWAVTRGPSLDPDDKRLAVRTEDHPLSYATFEGTIPKGEYGGGTVMLWDRGTWEPAPGKDPRKTLQQGHLHFTLHGERMKGEWLLIRLKPRPRERTENWLLRKLEDEHAGGSSDLVDREVTSVDSGRTMAEIAAGKTPSPHRGEGRGEGRSQSKASARSTSKRPSPNPLPAGERARALPLPAFRQPQLATLVDHVPPGSGWLHEVKYDGYRVLLAVSNGKARAYTRTGLDWSGKFQPIVDAAARAIPRPALIDGEVVVLDRKGHPDFQALQAAIKEGSAPFSFFAFDLLEEDGEDLTGLPNSERKERLAALLKGVGDPIHYSDHIVGNGEKLFDSLCREGLEGIVSKRADAPYRGRRVQSWLKVKCTSRQEFVIIGWMTSDRRRGFRSLLLGLNENGKLRYAGRVGTGFDAAKIEDLMARMKPLERKTPPVEPPRSVAKGAHWVSPKLVAEIAFTEFTSDGSLRHPSFIALREDKPAPEVVEEKPAPLLAVKISNPDRIIYPESGITKGELAAYYAAIADPLLVWLADRPVSLVRCPQGRAKHCFFQKHDAGSFGKAVRHVPIKEKDGTVEPYLYIDDETGLLTCVQMGTIEFHGWGSKVDDVEHPDRLVFDLDPDEGLDFADVKRAALQLRKILAEMGLVNFPMLSGGKGVHVVVPLDRTADWPKVKDFASRFARALAEAHPDRFTANMKKAERKGRIFLDWLRNQRGATAVLPYSARARPGATVAAPVTWDELDDIKSPGRFTIADVETLVERAGSRSLRGWGVADQRLPDL